MGRMRVTLFNFYSNC